MAVPGSEEVRGGMCVVDGNTTSRPGPPGRGFRVALLTAPARRVGLCCSSLAGLRDRVRQRFPGWQAAHQVRIFTADGTEVEDEEYWASLPSQSLLLAGTKPVLPTPAHDPTNVFDKALRKNRWMIWMELIEQIFPYFIKLFIDSDLVIIRLVNSH